MRISYWAIMQDLTMLNLSKWVCMKSFNKKVQDISKFFFFSLLAPRKIHGLAFSDCSSFLSRGPFPICRDNLHVFQGSISVSCLFLAPLLPPYCWLFSFPLSLWFLLSCSHLLQCFFPPPFNRDSHDCLESMSMISPHPPNSIMCTRLHWPC